MAPVATVVPLWPVAVTENVLPSRCQTGALAAFFLACAACGTAGMTGIDVVWPNAPNGRAKPKPASIALAKYRRILERPEQ
jgi:hypothetical protein